MAYKCAKYGDLALKKLTPVLSFNLTHGYVLETFLNKKIRNTYLLTSKKQFVLNSFIH